MARTSTLEERITELLAIMLYDHDAHIDGERGPQETWRNLHEEDREAYRDIATLYKTYGGMDEDDG